MTRASGRTPGAASSLADPLQPLLMPNGIAVVGASPDAKKPSGMVLGFLGRSSYAGEVFPVNPRYQQVDKWKCYPSLETLPTQPDLVVISTPTEGVLPVMESCVSAGIGAVLIMSGGFGEGTTGKAGYQRRDRLASLLAEGRTRVLGPNTVGFVNFTFGLPLTFADWYGRDSGLRGRVAVMTQSGSVGGLIFSLLQAGGVGVNYWIGLGNEVDLEVTDFLIRFSEAEDVDTVVCYLEGLSDGCRFVDAARAMSAAGKTIVVLKAGRSVSGQRSTLSHTGKLSSSPRHYAAAFEETGVVEATSLREMVSIVQLLQSPNRRKYTSTMGVMSASGGICSVLADHAADAGIEIPELSIPVQRRLAEVIPEVGSTQNPVDLSANVIAREEILAGTLDVLRTTKEVGTWVVFGRPILDRFHKRIADEGKRFEGNLIACSGVGLGAETADSLRDGGVPVVEDPEYCIRAIGRLASRRPLPEGPITPRGSALRRSFGNHIADQQRVYNTLLRHGLPVTRSHFFKSIADLQAATRAENFRFPLVVKAAMPQISHKTAANCVVLNVQDIPSLELAAANVIYNARRAAPEAEILIEIQEMSAFRHAIILTVTQDRDFGPMIMIGLAGVGIDLIDDVQILLFPATREAFLHALQRLKAWPLLAGFRGAKPCDVTALANIHDGITELYRAETWIGEIKLSPILVGEIGCGAVLVDAVVIEVD